jgi:hypothetical protein
MMIFNAAYGGGPILLLAAVKSRNHDVARTPHSVGRRKSSKCHGAQVAFTGRTGSTKEPAAVQTAETAHQASFSLPYTNSRPLVRKLQKIGKL